MSIFRLHARIQNLGARVRDRAGNRRRDAVLAIRALYADVTAAEAATVVVAHDDGRQAATKPASAAVLPEGARR